MKTQIEILRMLKQFYCTTNYYKLGSFYLTDGTKYLADECQCYWLFDIISSYQYKLKDEPFQVWKLDVTDSKAVVICDDGNGNILITQEIEFTDFPLDNIKLYFENNVLCLPSER